MSSFKYRGIKFCWMLSHYTFTEWVRLSEVSLEGRSQQEIPLLGKASTHLEICNAHIFIVHKLHSTSCSPHLSFPSLLLPLHLYVWVFNVYVFNLYETYYCYFVCFSLVFEYRENIYRPICKMLLLLQVLMLLLLYGING